MNRICSRKLTMPTQDPNAREIEVFFLSTRDWAH